MEKLSFEARSEPEELETTTVLEELDSSLPEPSPEEARLAQESQEILNNFDYQTLGSIFSEEFAKSGLPAEALKSFKASDVQINAVGMSANGLFDTTTNTIQLFPSAIEDSFASDKEGADKDRAFKTGFVSVLIHEGIHFAAGAHYSGDIIRNGYNVIPTSIDTSGDEEMSGDYGQGFSEAITDMFAEEVFNEYRRRTGESDMDDFNKTYGMPRLIARSFITHASKISDIPYDTVWGAVKQGYLSGLDLKGSELAKAFGSFTNEIASLDGQPSERDIVTLLERMEIDGASNEQAEQIQHGVSDLLTKINESLEYTKSHFEQSQETRDELGLSEFDDSVHRREINSTSDKQKAEAILARLRFRNTDPNS